MILPVSYHAEINPDLIRCEITNKKKEKIIKSRPNWSLMELTHF